MLQLLDDAFDGVAIRAFQYGMNNPETARPLFGLTLSDSGLEKLRDSLREKEYTFQEVQNPDEISYRLIPLRADLLTAPLFLDLEFYERPGALHSYMTKTIRGRGSFCYFNYLYSGERVGRALIGIDFASEKERDDFARDLPSSGEGFRSCHPLGEAAAAHLLG